ncbi:MAG: SprT family zinc-dependent metalloprotease [Parasphingorhabdus sp.]
MSTIFSPNRSEDLPQDLEIELDGKYYPIRVRRSAKARSISLSADTLKGEVKISLPRHGSIREALHFTQSKTEWLVERFDEMPAPISIENGTSVPFLGDDYRVAWSREYQRKPKIVDDEICLGGPENRVSVRVISWMKAQARETYATDLTEYCKRAGSKKPKLSIGDARRRWGSCSGNHAIRLNWRLIMAPPMVRRSVVAHEVAHLKHMNHSKAFYAHLDSVFEGDRKAADRWLKNHGNSLHLVGANQH